MRFSIYIDYASLFINTQKVFEIKTAEEIEEKIYSIIKELKYYIENYDDKRKNDVIEIKAFVLPDKQFKNPENTLGNKGINVIRVNDSVYKSDSKKRQNFSRMDDSILVSEARKDIRKDSLHGIVVVSNDSDFVTLARMVKHTGRFFWGVVYEGNGIRVKKQLKDNCDVYLRINELLLNSDDGIEDYEDDDTDLYEVTGKRLEIYKDSNLLMTYSIENRDEISIGRRSMRRKVLPNIDFTRYDYEKIISREHGNIYKFDNRLLYCVNNNCSRGTWYKLKAKSKGERFILEPDVPILLGDKNGFVMVYRDK